MAKRKNPFGEGDEPAKPKRTAEECCAIGNAKLNGPYISADGTQRHEGDNAYRARLGLPPVKWVVVNKVPTLIVTTLPESSIGKRIP